ncbi:hypothetical protein SQ11_12190 [Nitrosospira sp. NpAV]|nr:hypothetical protein SQ11_12190 [Nitrosospira sp. NpAV]
MMSIIEKKSVCGIMYDMPKKALFDNFRSNGGNHEFVIPGLIRNPAHCTPAPIYIMQYYARITQRANRKTGHS